LTQINAAGGRKRFASDVREESCVAWDIIKQQPEQDRPAPNLHDYGAVRAAFTWDTVRAEMAMPAGLNIAYHALDRHVMYGCGDKLALRWLGKNGEKRDYTYSELLALSNRFANLLRDLGVGEGDRVFGLLGRIPELYVAALGTLRNGSVFCPLFSAFGPEPVRTRMAIGDARVLVTTTALYRRKVADWRHELPGLQHVLLVDRSGVPALAGTTDFDAVMARASPESRLAATGPEDLALLHFTSGTTGRPKGAMHVHEAVLAHHITGRYALDLHPDDVFWCTADPGWVTGTSYGIIAPLTNGVTMIVDEAEFDAERWYHILQDERVTVWYTAPTAIRMLMKTGDEVVRKYDLSRLRFLASVGEPLNPEAVVWSHRVYGRPFHDNWWQTETGGIMIANFASMDIKPGSMGRELPGIDAAIVMRRPDGSVHRIEEPMTAGELALRPGWPSMFRGYLNEPERYRKCFVGGWYLTGDLAMRDADGYFWFVGRADDVIKSAGHLIGPFEVESALLEHPAVAEAGVIGKPDPVAGEIVKAFISLKPGFEAGEPLARELLGHARKRLGPAVAPKEIAFRRDLPRTRSGKIMRRLLRARELGLPEGDLSTLEDTPSTT
jgi:acetyl-CoA synthetase